MKAMQQGWRCNWFTGGNGFRARLRCIFILAILLFRIGTGAEITDDRVYTISIPEQSIAEALTSLSEQTDVLVLFPFEIARTRKSNAVSGEYMIPEAVEILLKGTGLSGGFSEKGVLTIFIEESDTYEESNAEIRGDEKPMSNRKNLFTTMLGAIFGVSGIAATQVASAQEGAQGVLEEIVVTSRRYEESLQDVPQSVSAMNDEYLEDQGIDRVTDILSFSPGGNFTRFNKMQDEYSIRGVSSQTEGASGDPSVVTVIDNVVITKDFMKNPAFFDMERVEILRGPQGTSFGRNASSGLIHLITARPEKEFRGGITADFGTHDAYGVEAFVTGAISDNLAGRLAFNFDSHDGYTDDTRTGDSLGGEQNVSVRGSLLFNPSEDLEIYVKAEYNKDDDDTPAIRKGRDCTIPYQADFPVPSVVGAPQPGWTQFPNFTDSCDPWETTISAPTYLGEFFLDREILNLSSEIVWDVNDSLTATAVLGYLDGDSNYLIDAHGGPNNSMFQSTQNDADQFSAEFRLDNHGSGDPLRWLVGVYYMQDDHARNDQNIFYVEDAVGDPQHPSGFRPEGRDVKQGTNETESLGLFGELSYDFTDSLNGTFGLRYSTDEKDYTVAHFGWGWGGPIELLRDLDAAGNVIPGTDCTFAPGGPPTFGFRFCGDPANPVGFTTPATTSADWDNVSFKGSLSYAVNDDVMIYGLISQGYKTGGFQPEPADPIDALTPFNEETVTNYEGGFKGEWGGRFRLNGSVFYTDYEDLQIFFFQGTPSGNFTQQVANAANVEILGVELDWVFQITENLRFTGSYANHDAELADTMIDLDGDGNLDNLDGTRPDNTPEWTGTAAIEYDFPLDSGSRVTLRADWRGVSNVFDDIGEQADRLHEGYDVVGARATWISADERWSVSVWGRNLFDEDYTVNVGPAQPNLNQLNFAYGPPQTFGGTVSYSFD